MGPLGKVLGKLSTESLELADGRSDGEGESGDSESRGDRSGGDRSGGDSVSRRSIWVTGVPGPMEEMTGRRVSERVLCRRWRGSVSVLALCCSCA